MQLLSSERSLSQYTIGRGSTRLTERLTSRKRASTAPSGALSPLAEEPPTKLNDWRQRFVEVRFLFCALPLSCLYSQGFWAVKGVGTPQGKACLQPSLQSWCLSHDRLPISTHRLRCKRASCGVSAVRHPLSMLWSRSLGWAWSCAQLVDGAA